MKFSRGAAAGLAGLGNFHECVHAVLGSEVDVQRLSNSSSSTKSSRQACVPAAATCARALHCVCASGSQHATGIISSSIPASALAAA